MKNKIIIILIVILVLIGLGSTSYVVYDKYIKKEKTPTIEEIDISNSEIAAVLYKTIKVDEGSFPLGNTLTDKNNLILFFSAKQSIHDEESTTKEKCISSLSYKDKTIKEVACNKNEEQDGKTYKPYIYSGIFIKKEKMDIVSTEIFGPTTTYKIDTFDLENKHWVYDEKTKSFQGYKEQTDENDTYNATHTKTVKKGQEIHMDYYTMPLTKAEYDIGEKQSALAQNLKEATQYKIVFKEGTDHSYYLDSINLLK